MGEDCSTKGLVRAINKCKYARNQCGEDFETLNMLAVQYCWFGNYSLVGIALSIAVLLLFMRHIEHVSEGYLSVAIAGLSKGLGLSELVAGSTLLALSNGATDLITAMVSATSTNSEGLDIVIGSLFGASLFSILCIFAAVIWASPEGTSLKEAGLMTVMKIYAVADIILLVGLFTGTPIMLLAVVFLGIYYLYIREVFKLEAASNAALAAAKSSPDTRGNDTTTIRDSREGATRESDSASKCNDGEESHIELSQNFGSRIAGVEVKDDVLVDRTLDETIDGIDEGRDGEINTTGNRDQQQGQNPFQILVSKLRFEISQAQGLYLLLYLLETSLKLATAFVVPASEDPFVQGLPMVLFVFTIPLFYAVANDKLLETTQVPVFGWKVPVLFVATTISLVLYKVIQPKYRRILFSIGGSVLVLDFFVGGIIDVLNFARIQFGIGAFFLAITILGVANSVVDLFVDKSLAAAGFTTMAVTGVFSGQLFNFLIGISMVGMVQSVLGTAKPVFLLDQHLIPRKKCYMISFVILAHLALLVLLSAYLAARDWIINNRLASLLASLYGLLLVVLTGMEFVL